MVPAITNNKPGAILQDASWIVAVEQTSERKVDPRNADVLSTRVADGIAVITLGGAKRVYFDQEMGDALTEVLDKFAATLKSSLSS